MGLFEFYCDSCMKTQEEIFSASARPERITCTSCGETARYTMSAGQFTVKGASAANNYAGDSNFKWISAKERKE